MDETPKLISFYNDNSAAIIDISSIKDPISASTSQLHPGDSPSAHGTSHQIENTSQYTILVDEGLVCHQPFQLIQSNHNDRRVMRSLHVMAVLKIL
jgi:hypothetical protein